MAVTTYSNVITNVQSTVRALIVADTTSLTATYNGVAADIGSLGSYTVVDGEPTSEMPSPVIVVRSPSVEEEQTSLITGFSTAKIRMEIQIRTNREGLLRPIVDRIRQVLRSNSATTQGVELHAPEIAVTAPIVEISADESGRLEHRYVMSIHVNYRWAG